MADVGLMFLYLQINNINIISLHFQICHEAIGRLNSCQEMLQSAVETNGEEEKTQPSQLSDDILFNLHLCP